MHARSLEMLEQAGVAATLLDTGVLTHEMRPHGMLRPAGFAAVGSAEALIHTYDVAAALGLPWIPAEDLTRLILDAVFPAAGPGPTADLLLHQTGRATSVRTPTLDLHRCRPPLAEHRPARRVRDDDLV